MPNIQQNSLQAWLLAARPKTLAAAICPMAVAIGYTIGTSKFNLAAAVICTSFALLMQIAANLINDLIDGIKGTDSADRLGPPRAIAQGWITKKAMAIGIGVTIATACTLGLCTLFFCGPEIILVGVLCIVFAYFYTSGPFPLSYNGLGDVAVVIFFGLVPVCGTCYVMGCGLNGTMALLAVSAGLAVDTLMVVNNYRDRDTDKQCGKHTLVTIFGEWFGRYLYLAVGIAAFATAFLTLSVLHTEAVRFALLLFLALHLRAWLKLSHIRQGAGLNSLLAQSSANMLVFGITTSLCLAL